MIETEKAYLAGLIDGEGSLCAYQFKEHGKLRSYHVCALKVTMTDKKIIEWCKNITNTGYTCSHKVPKGRKKQWDWTVRNKQLDYLLPIILPFLRVKAEHATKILKIRNLILGSEKERNKKEFSKSKLKSENWYQRDQLRNQIKTLNA